MSATDPQLAGDVVQAVEAAAGPVEKLAFGFAVELADWVKEHVAAHPVSRIAQSQPASSSGTPPA